MAVISSAYTGYVKPAWHTIHLGRDCYSKQDEIVDWCRANIGEGGWYSPNKQDLVWVIENNFGHISISFKHEADLIYFSLVWQ